MKTRIDKIRKQKINNQFKVSEGNLAVLSTIPYMMEDKKYRDLLRALVLDYRMEYNNA